MDSDIQEKKHFAAGKSKQQEVVDQLVGAAVGTVQTLVEAEGSNFDAYIEKRHPNRLRARETCHVVRREVDLTITRALTGPFRFSVDAIVNSWRLKNLRKSYLSISLAFLVGLAWGALV